MGTAPVETARALGERYDSGLGVSATRQRTHTAVGWVCLSIVFVLVLELTCRIEDWVTYRTPLLSRFTTINDLVIRDADGMHGRPNARFQKWVMNDLGVRGPAASAIPAEGTIRVITVGASETFGLRESTGREYPRQLEDSLNARSGSATCASSSRVHFEVLNAGIAGMTLPTIDQDVRNRLKRFRPAIIVVYPNPAQYLDQAVPSEAMPDSSGSDAGPPLRASLRPRLFDRMRERTKNLLPDYVKTLIRQMQTRGRINEHPVDWRFTDVPVERLAQYENDLRHLVGTIRRQGATPILATHGNMFMGGRKNPDPYALVAWEMFYPRATGPTIIAVDSVARLATLRVGKDSAVVTVDAAERLAAAPLRAFGDFVHFTDFGSSHMADAVANGVLVAARERAGCSVSDTGRAATQHNAR